MATQHETGHAKNVANFELLISHCTGFGSAYNPSQNAIKLTELNDLHSSAKNALADVADKLAKLTIARNERQLVFEPLPKLTTRLIFALDAAGPTQKIVADARTIARKITGRRKAMLPKKIEDAQPSDSEAKTSKQISASQLSFDQILENFKKLKELLEEETLYAPNENDLKITTLTTLISELTAKNTAVANAITALDNARTNRDHILYDKNTGLVDLASEVKKYIYSIFGPDSPEAGQIRNIPFTRP